MMSKTESPPSTEQADILESGLIRHASLIGWHGRENAGDDAFCIILCKWIIENFEVDQITVSASDRRLPKTLAELPVSIKGNEPDHHLGRVARFFQELKSLFGYDLVVFGGGSIFSRRRFWWLAVQLIALRTLRKLGLCQTKIAGIGISIGPFYRPTHSFWCRLALRQFDVLTVRDETSYQIGRAYGLSNLIESMDLALALPRFYELATRKRREHDPVATKIGFSIVDRDTELGTPEIDDRKRSALVQAMLGVAKVYPNARFSGFVFCKHQSSGDHKATRKVLDQLLSAGCEIELVEYENDPLKLCLRIAECDAMICNRMHSYVFSCITRTPAAMISYASKMDEFAKCLNLPDEQIYAHDAIDAKLLSQTLVQLIQNQGMPCEQQLLEERRSSISADLARAVEILRELDR